MGIGTPSAEKLIDEVEDLGSIGGGGGVGRGRKVWGLGFRGKELLSGIQGVELKACALLCAQAIGTSPRIACRHRPIRHRLVSEIQKTLPFHILVATGLTPQTPKPPQSPEVLNPKAT